MSVVGIYSFPKSGNTWMRQILAAAFKVPAHKVGTHLPGMHEKPILEIPVNFEGKKFFFYKSHSRYEQKRFENKIIENDHIIYVIRHPLDVFVSFVNYLSNNVTADAESVGISFKYESADDIRSTKKMEMLFHTFCVFGTLQPNSRGFGSWFSNAEYFINAAKEDPRIIIVRYEDLMTDFASSVRSTLVKIGHDGANLDDVKSAADKATSQDGKFFWKRKSGNYRDYLTSAQICEFYELHGERCRNLGYPQSNHYGKDGEPANNF